MGDATSPAELFTGEFAGTISGTNTLLSLRCSGGEVSGRMDAAGYVYDVVGRADGDRFAGELRDPMTGGRVPLQGAAVPGSVAFDAGAGPMVFARADAAGAAPGYPSPTPGQAYPSPASAPAHPGAPGTGTSGGGAGGAHDPRLVGRWRRTESNGSGDFSLTTDWHLAVSPDGTYETMSRSRGSGAGMSLGSDATPAYGRWQTQGATLLIDEGFGLQPYAQFSTDGAGLLLTLGNGGRQYWERV